MRKINSIININKTAFVAVLCLFFTIVSYAQITVDKPIGCSPHTAIFGAPGGSANHVWDFGDGFFANSAAPTHLFTSPGIYTVKYTGTAGAFQTIITVQPKPTAVFTAVPTSGCIPLSVQFTDQSVGAGGTAITGWQWTFGDGGSAGTKNPVYNYTLIGSFSASLIATDANGCKDDTTWTTPIVTSNTPPIANFTPSITQSCTAPLTVTFVNNSSSGKGGALSYLWDFGNGTTSTLTTPAAVTYNTTGVYNVKLTVTELNGCISSKTTAIVVSKPISSFSLLNDTICPNTNTLFTNTSLGATSYSWNFGDGSGLSAQVNPIHSYAAPGTYDVKLTASAGGCSDDTTFAIVVENVVANFTRIPSYHCDFPMQVKYTNTSVPSGVSWLWEFGDQKTANTQNPTHNFLKPDDSEYTVYDPLFFANKLTVTSAVGCRASVTKTDTINPIIARLQPDVSEGCAPLTVQFSDSSRSKELINFYHWDFGDGQNSAVKNPSHTYNTTGEYTVYLDIKNTLGCADTSYPIIIKVGAVTAPDFSVSSATVCPDQTVTLTDLTPGANVDSWHYAADGDNASSCPSDSNWTWTFNSKAGPQDITLTTGFNGCYSSKTILGAITVKGPVTRLNYTALCDSPYKYVFKGDISGADSWTWNFGDGQTILASTDTTVTHYYLASGNYTVKITGTNATSGCADFVDSVVVKVRDVNAVITMDSVICKQVPHTFSAASSTDVYSACRNGYRWDWGDGSPPSLNNLSSDSHTYGSIGTYNIRLIVSGENGCKDTANFNQKVFGIKAGFTMDNLSRCLPFTVNFNDTTHSDTTVVAWQWNFGDGSPVANTKSPAHIYNTGVGSPFTVRLDVTDKLGCTDNISKTVTPILPEKNFSAADLTLCTNVATDFTAVGTNIAQYTWDFGDGTPVVTTNNKTTQHSYTTAPGPYTVKLVVKDNNGCLDSLTKPAYMSVQSYPIAGFTSNADSSANLCYPFKAAFYDTSTAATPTTIVNWDVGTGDPVLAQSPVKFTYGQKGTYKVTLVVQTSYGCKDTTDRSFQIVGPEGDFDISDTLICIGESVNFQIKNTVDVASWEWDFGGSIVTGNPSPSHPFNFYPPGGINNVSLTLYTAGKTCSYTAIHAVRLHDAYARFGVNDSTLCFGDLLSLSDSSGGADSWQWVVSPGQTFNTQNVAPFALGTAGNYTVSLRISDNVFDCKDTITKKIVVNPLPVFSTADVALCKGSSKIISATNNVKYTYNWTPSATLTTPNLSSTLATPLTSTVYTVKVTDTTNSCFDSKTVAATVYSQTPFNLDTICVVIGETIDFGVDMGNGYTYNWNTGVTKYLSCTDCPTPSLKVLETGIYKLVIKDTLNCFESLKEYYICAEQKYTVDVPSAFSPDGDGINDLAFVKGWGIEKLIVFRIFNRWGEIVFESTDINQGWDGIYKGQPQNMESYVYYAEVQYYSGKNGSKTGSITIIR